VPGTNHFLFNPREIAFDEMTASRLQKLDENGQQVEHCPHPPHRFAYPLHMPLYRKFAQARCIIHLHTRAGSAVSMQNRGLLPSGQYALWLGEVGYFDYEGNLANLEEGERLAEAFDGDKKIVFMRAHGTMNWGESVPHAFILAWLVTRACENQVMALSGNSELYRPTPEVIAATPKTALSITAADGPFGILNWQAALRRVERLASDFNT
jgi:ribulose-5-phosphate 4-epimerase/fuculose-1-phosphate aldolase